MTEMRSIADASKCTYTSCYCEENIWKLCDDIQQSRPKELPACHVVFISNSSKSVPIWMQKSGEKESDYLCVWDYHVIMVHKLSEDESLVYDFDTVLPFPSKFKHYFSKALQDNSILTSEKYYRQYRTVPAQLFLEKFASDRSHMRKLDGSWLKDPPPYDCIKTAECNNNLDLFISMDCDKFPVGEALDSRKFYVKFAGNTHLL